MEYVHTALELECGSNTSCEPSYKNGCQRLSSTSLGSQKYNFRDSRRTKYCSTFRATLSWHCCRLRPPANASSEAYKGRARCCRRTSYCRDICKDPACWMLLRLLVFDTLAAQHLTSMMLLMLWVWRKKWASPIPPSSHPVPPGTLAFASRFQTSYDQFKYSGKHGE